MFDRDATVVRIAKLKIGLNEMRVYLKIGERMGRLAQAETCQTESGFWGHPKAARAVIEAGNAERSFLNPFNDLKPAVSEAEMGMETRSVRSDAVTIYREKNKIQRTYGCFFSCHE